MFQLLVQKVKRRLKIYRRSARGSAPSFMEEQKRIESFEKWCAEVELELHPKVSLIGTTPILDGLCNHCWKYLVKLIDYIMPD